MGRVRACRCDPPKISPTPSEISFRSPQYRIGRRLAPTARRDGQFPNILIFEASGARAGWLSHRQRGRFPAGKHRALIAAASQFLRLTAPFRDLLIQIRFIAPLKPPFKSPVDHRAAREGKPLGLGERRE